MRIHARQGGYCLCLRGFSGVWSADTVIVTCEVRVPQGDTLIIEPGVEVFFSVYCKFIVDTGAILRAVGTVNDTIKFDEHWSFPGNRWHGIRFLNASDSSRLEYCHLTHGRASGGGDDDHGGAIHCSNSSPTIRNCLIDSCSADNAGGGIFCTNNSNPTIDSNTVSGNSATNKGGGIHCYDNSNPTISNDTISGNSASGDGGGIYCDASRPEIQNCLIDSCSAGTNGGGIYCANNSNPVIELSEISRNTASSGAGGGIYCDNSSPTIRNNNLSGNSADYGGGIVCYSSSPSINNNIISRNSADANGGGIRCNENSSPTIQNCVIDSCSAGANGGGIHCINNSNPTISDNTIRGNSGGNGGGIYCSSTPDTIELNEISQNTAWNNGGGIYLSSASPMMNKNTIVCNDAAIGGGLYCTGSSPVLVNCILWGNDSLMIHQVSGSNVQITYSCLQSFLSGIGNIFDDPMFVDSCNDHHLDSLSPCINSGDPDPVYNDPDDTRADMGCYFFPHGTTPAPVKDLTIIRSGIDALLQWSPVDTTAFGNSVTVDYYIVYESPTPFGTFYYLGYTDTTNYSHEGAIPFTEEMFYEVTAYVGSIELLQSTLAQLGDHPRREELSKRLRKPSSIER